jgi:hypothetical protein
MVAMTRNSDRLDPRALPRMERRAALGIVAAVGVAACVWGFLSPDHPAAQLVFISFAAVLAVFSIFFLKLSLRRLRALRRLYEESAGAYTQPDRQ